MSFTYISMNKLEILTSIMKFDSQLTYLTIVLEAEQPIRKKKTMKALTEALQGMKVAKDLRSQFEDHLKSREPFTTSVQQEEAPSDTNPPAVPPPIWSAPSKTLENQMRKLFRLIGTDDTSLPEGGRVSNLVNDVKSGKARHRDIINAISSRSYEKERKARAEEVQQKINETRSFHLLRVRQPVAAMPGEPVNDEDDEMCRILELVSHEKTNTNSEATATPSTSKRPIAGGIQLPIVHSARKLKEMEAQQAVAAAVEESEFVTLYYVLDEGTALDAIGEFNSVQYVNFSFLFFFLLLKLLSRTPSAR
jgi:hypothetical protein